MKVLPVSILVERMLCSILLWSWGSVAVAESPRDLGARRARGEVGTEKQAGFVRIERAIGAAQDRPSSDAGGEDDRHGLGQCLKAGALGLRHVASAERGDHQPVDPSVEAFEEEAVVA
ncbi:hypothetical protein [Streptomyces sp. NBC_01006]|uniref:hypothetical protein n=1 Tax=Streptomyces sp. NBC_01006 TaxID=2903716 RepID=UPI00386EE04F|nr:hypothetical protein OG509_32970 [Streptomyces sp. NBC_01006]